jgi:hypothetical protein
MSGPLVDKQQKSGEHVENIKFSLDTQRYFIFSTYSSLYRGLDVSSRIYIHDNHIQV